MRRGTSAHGDAYVLDTAGGVAHYRPPGPMQFLFGGTGILISRGALDRIPSEAWELFARRQVQPTRQQLPGQTDTSERIA